MEGHGGELLVLGVLFVIAYALGRLGKIIGVPAIPVYMVVGLLASPYTEWFPLSFETSHVELIASFGLVLLLFNLGLEFDQDEFFGNARALLVAGGSRLLINFAVGFGIGFWVGWGGREALIIAGMTGISSSAIVTKLLIELRRLANRETPVILGIAVVEDVFIALYLSIVSVVLGGASEPWAIALELAIAFVFLVVMFAVARWGGRLVSKLTSSRDDELFTILFFALAISFAGLGEILGVSDAIGAFLIGLVLGATRHRERIEKISLPLRDVFAAFFFLNFGLALDPRAFGTVAFPVAVAVVITIIVNMAGGQLIAKISKLTPSEGLNVGGMLTTRGEFAIILATLALAAGLDERLVPFAGLYVLAMAIAGPMLAVNSEKLGALLRRPRRAKQQRDAERDAEMALAEAAMLGEPAPDIETTGGIEATDVDMAGGGSDYQPTAPAETGDPDVPTAPRERPRREVDPEY